MKTNLFTVLDDIFKYDETILNGENNNKVKKRKGKTKTQKEREKDNVYLVGDVNTTTRIRDLAVQLGEGDVCKENITLLYFEYLKRLSDACCKLYDCGYSTNPSFFEPTEKLMDMEGIDYLIDLQTGLYDFLDNRMIIYATKKVERDVRKNKNINNTSSRKYLLDYENLLDYLRVMYRYNTYFRYITILQAIYGALENKKEMKSYKKEPMNKIGQEEFLQVYSLEYFTEKSKIKRISIFDMYIERLEVQDTKLVDTILQDKDVYNTIFDLFLLGKVKGDNGDMQLPKENIENVDKYMQGEKLFTQISLGKETIKGYPFNLAKSEVVARLESLMENYVSRGYRIVAIDNFSIFVIKPKQDINLKTKGRSYNLHNTKSMYTNYDLYVSTNLIDFSDKDYIIHNDSLHALLSGTFVLNRNLIVNNPQIFLGWKISKIPTPIKVIDNKDNVCVVDGYFVLKKGIISTVQLEGLPNEEKLLKYLLDEADMQTNALCTKTQTKVISEKERLQYLEILNIHNELLDEVRCLKASKNNYVQYLKKMK